MKNDLAFTTKTCLYRVKSDDEDQVSLFVRLRGTILSRIYITVFIYILYVAGIVSLHFYFHVLGLSSSIIGVLGVIISLLLGFRTNSAHSKYVQGRRVWANLKTTVRSIARTIWISVPSDTSSELVANKSAINLLDAFCHSLKHYLREEYSDKEGDVEPFVKPIQKFEFRSETLSKSSIMSKMDPYLACSFRPPTNIPNEILYQLSLYARATIENYPDNKLMYRNIMQGINGLEFILSDLESLRRTPIPVCYSAHLTQAFWIYLLILPFQIVNNVGWWVIPTLGITFFAFEGCLAISREMEDPFGYDVNDLPLDTYCWTIRKELEQITAIPTPEFKDWACSDKNFPLLPHSEISAAELCDKSLDDAKTFLTRVEFECSPTQQTREHWKKISEDWENISQDVNAGVTLNGPANV